MSSKFLFDGPEDAAVTILLAHGAGAPMDSPALNATARVLAEAGFRVARFEFGYMAGRRTAEGRKPPPRAETLMGEFRAVVEVVGEQVGGPVFIGGKSMGGRVASLVADELSEPELGVRGLVCLGYPFHPPYGSRRPAWSDPNVMHVPNRRNAAGRAAPSSGRRTGATNPAGSSAKRFQDAPRVRHEAEAFLHVPDRRLGAEVR